MGQDAIEQTYIGGELRQLGGLRVVRALGRGDQQTQHKGGHRGDQSHSKFHDIFGFVT
jgi:hypothetical protein